MTGDRSFDRAVTIGLLGQFGSGNSGNDGSLRAMVDRLQRQSPDARLLSICTDPEKVGSQLGIPAVHTHAATAQAEDDGIDSGVAADGLLGALPRRLGDWTYALRVVRTIDALVIPGTGIFDDFQDGPFGWPYVVFRWCALARLSRVPVAFVSIGAGPIHRRAGRFLAGRALATARYRSYRDGASKDFATGLGIDTRNDAVYPDIAFGLPVPREPDSGDRTAGERAVGLGVMAYTGWHKGAPRGEQIYRAYLDKIGTFAAWLVETGHSVRLITGDAQDERAVVDLMRRPDIAGAAEKNRLVAAPTESLSALMRQIARTDIVVATRFHNIVCALKLRRPTISIGYAAKNDDLLAGVGMGDFCQHIESLDIDRLKDQFLAASSRLEDLKGDLDRGVTAIEQRLAGQDDRLFEILFKGRGQPGHISGGTDESTAYGSPRLHRQHHAAHAPERRA